jgi:hypothetical protein
VKAAGECVGWLIPAGVLAACVVAWPATPAAGSQHCSGSVRAYPSGPNIIATNIRVVRVGCRPAKRLLRTYFRQVLGTAQVEGGCAHQRQNVGCRVNGWRCYSRYDRPTNSLKGRCARRSAAGKRLIYFDERDIGPG